MELSPFWQRVLVGAIAFAFIAIFVWRPLMRRRRKTSQLADILRKLSEEREAQMAAEERSGVGTEQR